MAENKISTSKKEIYTKLLDIAEKYTDIKNSDFLKTGLFGYMTESMAMMMRDSTLHKSMIYNESFLNTAILPKSVYNWAKMFNIEVQKAIPKYAEVRFVIPKDALGSKMKSYNNEELIRERYGFTENDKPTGNYLILDKENPIIAGDYNFSLEHSILIEQKINSRDTSFTARYITTEYESTSFQELTKEKLVVTYDQYNIYINARIYQYKTTVYNRQITSTSFLNKVQRFQFQDQFCGAKLFYEEGNNLKEIDLYYSDMNKASGQKIAYYNLIDEDELEILFKIGTDHFIPSVNTKLKVCIYTTKALDVPSHYSGEDALMIFSDNDIKSLPLIIEFNPTTLLGGKSQAGLSDIKTTIINEISTRNTITTKTDLNNYFAILTSLIEDINDGKVTFIKKRDDIVKRAYNAYLLLRDNLDDTSTESTINNQVLSSVIPTNTMNVKISSKNDTTKKSINLNYPKFDIDGNQITNSDNTTNDFYVCPFNIFITTDPVNFVKYIYNMTDCEAEISYSTRSNDSNDFHKDYYMIPEKVTLFRGFSSEGSYSAARNYVLKIYTTTNFSVISNTSIESTENSLQHSGEIKITTATTSLSFKNFTISSEANDKNSFTTIIEINIPVANEDEEFFLDSTNIKNDLGILGNPLAYCNTITLKDHNNNKVAFSDKEKISIDLTALSFNNKLTGLIFDTNSELTFYEHLDDIMDSSLILTGEDENNSPAALTDVPLLHASFFKANKENNIDLTNRKTTFIKQLFTYIEILKNNLNRLETSTFFNLKFYNTYGYSNYYYTDRTNLSLDMEIVLLKQYEVNQLEGEIRSYIRKLIDRMNLDKAINISSLISTLSSSETYGPYIKYIKFVGLNGTFNQYIESLSDISEELYPPEWLSIDPECLQESSPNGLGIRFKYE